MQLSQENKTDELLGKWKFPPELGILKSTCAHTVGPLLVREPRVIDIYSEE